jgi:uncharacterized protein YutD
MILFHGSNVEIENIDLNICKPFKDFGRGFYTTEYEEQARGTAERTARLFGGRPCVTSFSIDATELKNCKLQKKIFKSPSNEWALFVINNRNRNFTDIKNLNCNLDNKYDIVMGPVANDDIRLLFGLFEDQYLTINELTKRLKYKKLTSQISFHTNSSINLLRKENVCNL